MNNTTYVTKHFQIDCVPNENGQVEMVCRHSNRNWFIDEYEAVHLLDHLCEIFKINETSYDYTCLLAKYNELSKKLHEIQVIVEEVI